MRDFKPYFLKVGINAYKCDHGCHHNVEETPNTLEVGGIQSQQLH